MAEKALEEDVSTLWNELRDKRGDEFAELVDELFEDPTRDVREHHYLGTNMELFNKQGGNLQSFLLYNMRKKDLVELVEKKRVMLRGASELMSDYGLGSLLLRTHAEELDIHIPRPMWLTKDQYPLKLGIDPTADSLHLGQYALLKIIKRWQDFGYHAVIIDGLFTVKIGGDPSWRITQRTPLKEKVIEANSATIREQVESILVPELTTIINNEEFYKGRDAIRKLLPLVSVNRLLQRAEFRERYKQGITIPFLEFIYPVVQGMDSVHINAGVEFGGRDQTFNIMLGRELQAKHGKESQIMYVIDLLEGSDGRKMSKSFGNYIGLDMSPEDIYGGVMRIPDHLITRYLTLLTDMDMEYIRRAEIGLGRLRQTLVRAGRTAKEHNLTGKLNHKQTLKLMEEPEMEEMDVQDEIPLVPCFRELEALLFEKGVERANYEIEYRAKGWSEKTLNRKSIGRNAAFGFKEYGNKNFLIIPKNKGTRLALENIFQEETDFVNENPEFEPYRLKMHLAYRITEGICEKECAEKAKLDWQQKFMSGEIPDALESVIIDDFYTLPEKVGSEIEQRNIVQEDMHGKYITLFDAARIVRDDLRRGQVRDMLIGTSKVYINGELLDLEEDRLSYPIILEEGIPVVLRIGKPHHVLELIHKVSAE